MSIVNDELVDLRKRLESQQTDNTAIASCLFASSVMTDLIRNAVAYEYRRAIPRIDPNDYLPVLYDIWTAPDWKWSRYVHLNNEGLRGYVFRVAQRTIARWVRKSRPGEASVEPASLNCSVDEQFFDESDSKKDLYNHIVSTQMDRRVRLVLLMLLETSDMEVTANRLGISVSSVHRYVREGMPHLYDWLAD